MAPKAVPAPAPTTNPRVSPAPIAGLLVRLYWLAFGNLILLAMILRSMQNRDPGVADAVYWVGGLALIVVRLVDVRHFHGSTFDGAPATMGHWRRYAVGVAILIGAAWTLARWVAPVSI